MAVIRTYGLLFSNDRFGIKDYHVYEISYGIERYANSIAYINSGDWGKMDWQTVTADQVELRLKKWWKREKLFFSKQEAIESLPDEIILHYGKGNTSISPYDSYGYHIVSISAHSGGAVYGGEGVFVHIRR